MVGDMCSILRVTLILTIMRYLCGSFHFFVIFVYNVNSCVVGGRIARNLFYFILYLVYCMCLYIFLQLFVRRIVP